MRLEAVSVVTVLQVSTYVGLEESDVTGGGPGDLVQEIALREPVVVGLVQVDSGQ